MNNISGGNTIETCKAYESEENWSISGNILTLKYDETTENAIILELSTTTLKLKYEEKNIDIFTYKKV